ATSAPALTPETTENSGRMPLCVRPTIAPAPKAPPAPPPERARMLKGRFASRACSRCATRREGSVSNWPSGARVRTPNDTSWETTSSGVDIGSCGPNDVQPAETDAMAQKISRCAKLRVVRGIVLSPGNGRCASCRDSVLLELRFKILCLGNYLDPTPRCR